MEYWVRWEINVEADSSEDAAAKALEIQRDPESLAVVFDVRAIETMLSDGGAKWVTVDVAERKARKVK